MHGSYTTWEEIELVSDLLYEISRNKRDWLCEISKEKRDWLCEISRKKRMAVRNQQK